MKRRNPISILGAWLALALAPGHATGTAAPQDAAGSVAQGDNFGTVTGRVLNGSTGNPLQGAEVRIVGTPYETYTDSRGIYRLPRVPTGRHEIRVNYLGHDPAASSVTVASGTTVESNFSLGGEVLMMEKFQVTSIMEGQARAINRQRASDTITTVIASDDAGNLPDLTINDLLGRVAGISMSGGGGVTIRGASPDLNSVMLDGERMSSSAAGEGGRLDSISDSSGEAEGREVSVDNIDADLIASVEVIRALPANMDADGIGGAINLVTRSSLDLGRRIIRGRADYTNNNLGGDAYGLAFTYGDVAEGNRWGYILNLTHGKDRTAFERGDTTYNFTQFAFPWITSLGYRYNRTNRTRYGINTTLDYKLGAATSVYLKAFYNRTDEDLFSSRAVFATLTNPNPATASAEFAESLPVNMAQNNAGNRRSNFGRHPSDFQRARDYYRISFGGRSDLQRLRFEYEVNFDHSATGQDGIRVMARTPILSAMYPGHLDRQTGWAIDRSDPTFPTITLTNPWRPTQNPILTNDTMYADLVEVATTPKKDNYEQGYNARLDGHMPTEFLGLPVTLQSGFKYRGKFRNTAPQWARLGLNLTAANALPAQLRPVEALFLEGGFSPPPMADGKIPSLGTFTNARAVYDYYLDVLDRQTPEQSAAGGPGLINSARLHQDVQNNLRRTFSADEDIFSGYVMGTIDVQKLRLMPGLRVEHTRNGYKGKIFNQSMTRIEPATAKTDYTNLFPSVVSSYRFTRNHVLRASFTNTIARPNYAAMAPFEILPDDEDIDDPTIAVEVGNPNLEAQTSRNLDLAYEWYFQPVGLLTISGFQKDIEKFIYRSVTWETVRVNMAGPGEPPDFVDVIRQRGQQLNGADARLRGVEVSWQHHLKFLPSPFNGLGFNVNYTYIQGRSRVPDDLNGGFTTFDFLFRQAKDVYNAQLFYEKSRFKARVAVRHNGGYVKAINIIAGNAENSVLSPTSYWDASLQYALSRTLTVYLEGKNLSKELTTQYISSPDNPTNWETRDWGYRVGVRWNFR